MTAMWQDDFSQHHCCSRYYRNATVAEAIRTVKALQLVDHRCLAAAAAAATVAAATHLALPHSLFRCVLAAPDSRYRRCFCSRPVPVRDDDDVDVDDDGGDHDAY